MDFSGHRKIFAFLYPLSCQERKIKLINTNLILSYDFPSPLLSLPRLHSQTPLPHCFPLRFSAYPITPSNTVLAHFHSSVVSNRLFLRHTQLSIFFVPPLPCFPIFPFSGFVSAPTLFHPLCLFSLKGNKEDIVIFTSQGARDGFTPEDGNPISFVNFHCLC